MMHGWRYGSVVPTARCIHILHMRPYGPKNIPGPVPLFMRAVMALFFTPSCCSHSNTKISGSQHLVKDMILLHPMDMADQSWSLKPKVEGRMTREKNYILNSTKHFLPGQAKWVW